MVKKERKKIGLFFVYLCHQDPLYMSRVEMLILVRYEEVEVPDETQGKRN